MCTKYLTHSRHWKSRVLSSLCTSELWVLSGSHEAKERESARPQAGERVGRMPKFHSKWWRPTLWTQCHTELAWGDLASGPAPTPSIWDLRQVFHFLICKIMGFLLGLKNLWFIISHYHFCMILNSNHIKKNGLDNGINCKKKNKTNFGQN